MTAAGMVFALILAGQAGEAAAASRNYYKAPVIRTHNNTPPRYGVVRHRNWTANAGSARRFESRSRKTGQSVYKYLHPDGPSQGYNGTGRGRGLYYYAGNEEEKENLLLLPPRLYPLPSN